MGTVNPLIPHDLPAGVTPREALVRLDLGRAVAAAVNACRLADPAFTLARVSAALGETSLSKVRGDVANCAGQRNGLDVKPGRLFKLLAALDGLAEPAPPVFANMIGTARPLPAMYPAAPAALVAA